VRLQGFTGDVEEEMQAFISGEGCIRVVIDWTIDRRVDWIGCKDGEEAC
jgi:hypothetical protein